MDNVAKIQRVSAIMQWACRAYLVLAPVLLLSLWLNFERWGPELEQLKNLPIQMQNLGPVNLLLGFLVSAIPISLLMYGVWRLQSLFGSYRAGSLFTETNARHLHAFAAMLLASVMASPISAGLLSLVLTMNNPPGQRAVRIDFSSNDLAVLFIAGVFLAVAWIMREGYRLASENAEFV